MPDEARSKVASAYAGSRSRFHPVDVFMLRTPAPAPARAGAPATAQ